MNFVKLMALSAATVNAATSCAECTTAEFCLTKTAVSDSAKSYDCVKGDAAACTTA